MFCVLRCSFTSTSNSGRRQRHLTWSSHPRGAHLLMLQGREINLLFLSPAPGIEPGSAGVRLQRFTHRPRNPDARIMRVYAHLASARICLLSTLRLIEQTQHKLQTGVQFIEQFDCDIHTIWWKIQKDVRVCNLRKCNTE